LGRDAKGISRKKAKDHKMNYSRLSKYREVQGAPDGNSPISSLPDGTCHHWNEMSDALQIAYLDGFLDGLELGALYGVVECVVESCSAAAATTGRSKINKIAAQFTAPGIPLDQMREGVATILKRPENSRIEISGALKAFIMEVNGKPQSDIDAFLTDARAGAIKNQIRTNPNK
jgi:hypothetical protein